MLMPVYLGDWVPAGHEIHVIGALLDQLDLSKIEGAYPGGGQPAYHPRMMVKILFYAYRLGVRSSRQIERMLYENIPMRVLSGNQQPDHWTVNQFRRRHQEALGELFRQTVSLAMKAGLVDLKHVAGDGTKLKANASKHNAMSYRRMEEAERRISEEIDAYFKEADAVDEAEDREMGDRSGYELPPHLRDARKRLEVIRKAKAELEAEAKVAEVARQTKLKKEGRKPRKDPEAARPKAQAQRNFTDPDSRVMKRSRDFIQGYNGQVAVDATHQIIVAADLTNLAPDAPHLPKMVDQVRENCGRDPDEMSFDAGYYSRENLELLRTRHVEAFIPPERISHMHWRTSDPPRGRIPKSLDEKGRMMRKLRTKRGKARYRLRETTVEPVIGQITWNRNLRQLPRRGLQAAKTAWLFECALHNLLKIAGAIRAGTALPA